MTLDTDFYNELSWSELSRMTRHELTETVEWYPPTNRDQLMTLSDFCSYMVYDNRHLLSEFLMSVDNIFVWTLDGKYGTVYGFKHNRNDFDALKLNIKNYFERTTVSANRIFSMHVDYTYLL